MPRFWSPFQLSQEARQHLVNNKMDGLASGSDLQGPDDLILVVSPDQQLRRWRDSGISAKRALEQLLTLYADVVAALEPQPQVQTERELLNLDLNPVDPLTAAVLLQLLVNTPALADNLARIDACLTGNDLSRQRLLDSCQSGLPLIEAWWNPHNGEANRMEVLLMQQQQQLNRLTRHHQPTSSN